MNKQIYSPPIVDSGQDLPPLPLAAAGCSAAAWGSGAAAGSSAAAGTGTGVVAREWDPSADAAGSVGGVDLSPGCRHCSETAFDDLGLGTSSGTGNLEHSLVE